MKLAEITKLLNAVVLTGESTEQLDSVDIHTACGSDLMSDVLAFVKEILTRENQRCHLCSSAFIINKSKD